MYVFIFVYAQYIFYIKKGNWKGPAPSGTVCDWAGGENNNSGKEQY